MIPGGITLDKKNCNFCGEEISSELRRCPYCGSLLGSIKKGDINASDTMPNAHSSVNVAQMCVEQNDDGTIVIKECEEMLPTEAVGETMNSNEANTSQSRNSKQSIPVVIENKRLSNGMKVFLTILSTVIPGLGQLIGIIISVIFINSNDSDRNSFGVALMIASLLLFVLSCLSIFISIMVFVIK